VLIGAAVCLLAVTTNTAAAFAVIAVVGACGGFFIVPLNALLQERGRESVGAGHAIAVQNLAENSVMLVMIGLYTLAVRAGAPISGIAGVFGAALSVAIAALWVHRVRNRPVQAVDAG
jgi:LPLT family lysophospholipid transporter-like MFS transporter